MKITVVRRPFSGRNSRGWIVLTVIAGTHITGTIAPIEQYRIRLEDTGRPVAVGVLLNEQLVYFRCALNNAWISVHIGHGTEGFTRLLDRLTAAGAQ